MAKGKKKIEKEEKLEDILFSCRDNLRGRASMTDKRDLLLTLVFLKFVFDRFDEQTERLREEFKAMPDLLELQLKKPASYGKKGVIFLRDEYRWDKLVNVEPVRMAVAFDDAIRILEQQEEKLRNALPQGIFTHCGLEPQVLKSVVDNINKIDCHRIPRCLRGTWNPSDLRKLRQSQGKCRYGTDDADNQGGYNLLKRFPDIP